MDNLPPDPYKALGVSKDADLAAIRSAHRKLVLKCHPDKVQDPQLKAVKQDEFQSVQQAYELLSDDKRRLAYDEKVKLLDLRREMGRGNPTARSNPFEYEVRTAEPRSSSNVYTRPQPNVYAQPSPRSYEDVSYDDQARSAPRKSTSYESSDRKRNSTREDDRERDRRRHEEDERARQKTERKAEKTVHSDKKKSRDKERRRGTEEKTRTRVTSAYVEEDSEDDYREPPPRGFEKKTSKHRMEDEIRMREDLARVEQAARAEREARADHAQRIARERERERERPSIKPSVPLDPKWDQHMDFAGQYMQAAKRKGEGHVEHPPMRRAETFAAPSPKYNIRYATPTQQISDDESPRRSSARKETRRTSDTPVARPESSSREKANKGSRRSPPHPQDPYIVEPPSPSLKKPSFQTHSSAPPILPTFRKEPSRSKTQDYPRSDKTPPLPRAATFTTTGDRGDRGRERGGSRLKKQVYSSESDSDAPIYSSPRHSHSPQPQPQPRRSEPTRYIIDNGRSIPVKSTHRSELNEDYNTRDRSESPRGSPSSRPQMPRHSSERPRTATRSQSQAYYTPPDPPHAEPIILTARPKMSPREGSGGHRSSPRGSGGPYFGEVKYMMPQYSAENVIYSTSHPPSGGDWSGGSGRRGGNGGAEYSYTPAGGSGRREQIYT